MSTYEKDLLEIKFLSYTQVSKDLEELLKLAVNQVQRQRGLSKRTLFHRIDLTNSSTDSLTGNSSASQYLILNFCFYCRVFISEF